MAKETYRVEIRLPHGWSTLPRGDGFTVSLTLGEANALATTLRENEDYYVACGCSARRIRVVRESDGRSFWLA
jgi:hypothetical protein